MLDIFEMKNSVDVIKLFEEANEKYLDKKYIEAIEMYKTCIRASTNDKEIVTKFYHNLATSYIKTVRYDKAIDIINKFKNKGGVTTFNMGFNEAYCHLKMNNNSIAYDICLELKKRIDYVDTDLEKMIYLLKGNI